MMEIHYNDILVVELYTDVQTKEMRIIVCGTDTQESDEYSLHSYIKAIDDVRLSHEYYEKVDEFVWSGVHHHKYGTELRGKPDLVRVYRAKPGQSRLERLGDRSDYYYLLN